MAVTASEWLITSDVAQEVAFRVDLPEAGHGRWVLSYLPTHRRLTRAQAFTGLVLAEYLLLEWDSDTPPFDTEIAALHAAELGLTLHDVMCLLALRAGPHAEERPGPSAREDTANAVEEGTTVFAV
ncbi:hypothetical protein [Nocardia lijiangensis]|uniref:hypothetical protein n=1 Tax=Nocardia lijiangensis TaxID=299618 RepID=UPI00083625F8|nr:hypothetical protein [Nocardia lijiangensis]